MGEVSPLNELYERYRDRGFEFLTVYVREPHPGENYREHRSFEQKLQYARECREKDGIRTLLVVDDLEGTMHRAYGEMPNMCYIVAKDGRIFYKAMWTDHNEIESVLETLVRYDEALARGERIMPSYTERLSIRNYGRDAASHVLERAGPRAIADFEAAIGGRR